MRFVRGFDDQILEALESGNRAIHYEAMVRGSRDPVANPFRPSGRRLFCRFGQVSRRFWRLVHKPGLTGFKEGFAKSGDR